MARIENGGGKFERGNTGVGMGRAKFYLGFGPMADLNRQIRPNEKSKTLNYTEASFVSQEK